MITLNIKEVRSIALKTLKDEQNVFYEKCKQDIMSYEKACDHIEKEILDAANLGENRAFVMFKEFWYHIERVEQELIAKGFIVRICDGSFHVEW